jgi:hypothetical protein
VIVLTFSITCANTLASFCAEQREWSSCDVSVSRRRFSDESTLTRRTPRSPLAIRWARSVPEHWAQYGSAYRQVWASAGHGPQAADIAVAVHGFVGDDDREAKATYLAHERRMFEIGSAEIGRPMRDPSGRGGRRAGG